MKLTAWAQSILADPRSHVPLAWVRRDDMREMHPIGRTGFDAPQFGLTDVLFTTGDGAHAYPVSEEGFPVLMWPDVLLGQENPETVDLNDHRYAEAYAEMEFYNPVAYSSAKGVKESRGFLVTKRLQDRKLPEESFPEPVEAWVDVCFDIEAKIDASRYIAPVRGKTVLQLGGQGRDAARLLLAGASEAILVTPMIGEAALAWAVAENLGLSDRFSCILGVGEEIPIRSESIDIVTSQGCLHHMQLDLALKDIHRVLKIGGRFAAVDPWHTPIYNIGTKLLGKREQKILSRGENIFCRPITDQRLSQLGRLFPEHAVHNHGPLLRYPLLALNKFRITPPPAAMYRLSRLDDRLGRLLRLPAKWGGSVMIGGVRS